MRALHAYSANPHARPMPLLQLARLLPAGRLAAWRGAAAALRGPAAAPRPPRFCAAAAAAELDAAGMLTDLEVQPGQLQHGVYGDQLPPAGPPAQAASAAAAGAAGPGQPQQLGSRTGAFQRLPMVSPAKELLDSALRRAARVGANKKLKNEAQKAKNRWAGSLGRGPGSYEMLRGAGEAPCGAGGVGRPLLCFLLQPGSCSPRVAACAALLEYLSLCSTTAPPPRPILCVRPPGRRGSWTRCSRSCACRWGST